MSQKIELRRSAVLAALPEERMITITSIAERLDLPVHTVHRDLNFLRDVGYRIDASAGRGGGIMLRVNYERP